MNIGIVPNLSGTTGGVYQYSLNMIRALSRWSDEGSSDNFIIFSDQSDNSDIEPFIRKNLTIRQLNSTGTVRKLGKSILNRAIGEDMSFKVWEITKKMDQRNIIANGDIFQKKDNLREKLRKLQIDFMIYPTSNSLSFEIGIPYIFVIHDLQHRLQPQFPEVGEEKEYQEREYIFRNGIRYANLVVVDSKVGKEDVLSLYSKGCGIGSTKIEILPFVPAYYLLQKLTNAKEEKIKKKYNFLGKYIFYPAQFWPHKNHKRIIQSIVFLQKEKNIRVPIVFTGAAVSTIQKRTLQECIMEAKKYNISDLIHYIGYVSNEEMSYLYTNAEALVMPTFFGPTNIPILEAWQLNCPVITSDIRGIREQVGNAGLLVNPKSISSIAQAIYSIWTDTYLQSKLRKSGETRLNQYTFDDYYNKLKYIIMKAKSTIH